MASVQSDGISLPILVSHTALGPGTGLDAVELWRSEEGVEAGRARMWVSERVKIVRYDMWVSGGCIAANDLITVGTIKPKRRSNSNRRRS